MLIILINQIDKTFKSSKIVYEYLKIEKKATKNM